MLWRCFMSYIDRPQYDLIIQKFIDKPVIKILTGMRRVGKSTLLKMVHDKLLSHVSKNNKIQINLDSFHLLDIRDAMSFTQYLKPLLAQTTGKIYFLFDEIQLVSGWEKVVNGLQVDYDCDIYLTGSNSNMLSGDLATMLAGRYVNFEIQPFTFKEFKKAFLSKKLTDEQLFQQFLQIGGMPFLTYFDLDKEPSFKYLNDVYHTVLVKDVLEYNKIRDVDIFNRILTYVVENIGHTFSALSIRNYFKNEGRTVSVDTILNYLEYCQKAFLIKKVSRYDALGKKLLKVEEKYYLTDHGLRQARGFSNTKDIERTLENIVYIELISRGYHVKIGKVNQQEIDFIAEKDGEIVYYQVSYLMESEVTRQREFGVYHNITDNYPKYVLSMDTINFSQNGIQHQNIIQFLLNDEYPITI